MHIFTSITSNYLPKARVLAESVKQVKPDATFHVVLNDRPPEGFELADEPFDNLIRLEQLPVGRDRAWLFKHTVVELCTATKGMTFLYIADWFKAEQVYYLDPDIVVFDGLDALERLLESHRILLTPHQIEPETEPGAVADNEIASLKHGIYNLGFLGVRPVGEGRRFLEWWDSRLRLFCYDDIPGGLFTDQRWVDLAPAFFQGIHILREPRFNVATWNLTHRQAAGNLADGITINGQPLAFYHFSGFDGGAQATMLNKYGKNSPALFELRKWYIAACEARGQSVLGKLRPALDFFDDGTPIARHQRVLYRGSPDLQRRFPDPYAVNSGPACYRDWYATHIGTPDLAKMDTGTELRDELAMALQELDLIKRSRSWRLARLIARTAHGFRR